jgi:hypothetical protein
MLAWVWFIAFVVTFVSAAWQRGVFVQYRQIASNKIAELHWKLSESGYRALEKGMDEQQESFEQEYLTWNEQRENYKRNIEWLNDDLNILIGAIEGLEHVIRPKIDADPDEAEEVLTGIMSRAWHRD